MATASYVGINGVARKMLKKYVGINGVARKISKGYAGINGVARKFFGGTNQTVVMTQAWTECSGGGNTTLTQQHNFASTVYDDVPGTGWRDAWHNLVIVLQTPCQPTAINFLTPTIVNSAQADEITYRIYGSNSAWNANISSMSWDTLVSETTIAHNWQGGQNISIPISTATEYKYLRMMCTWFYGANDYHGVHWHKLSVTGIM